VDHIFEHCFELISPQRETIKPK